MSARPAHKMNPTVGAEKKSGDGWFWKLAIGAVIGAVGYKLIDEAWPRDGVLRNNHPNNPTGIRVPAGVITGDQYDCHLCGDGHIVCMPKPNWPASWTVGGEQ